MIRNDSVSSYLHYYSKDKGDVVPALEEFTPSYEVGLFPHCSSVQKIFIESLLRVGSWTEHCSIRMNKASSLPLKVNSLVGNTET